MVFFDNCNLYIESKTTIAGKIAAIDSVITSLYSALLKAANNEDVSEYQLNDGQTIIKQVNRGVKGITQSIQALRIIRQDYINQINGRVFRGMDSKNFRNGYGGQY